MTMRKRFLTLLCCSAACLTLGLTACDDGGEPGDPTDTTTTDTTSGGDTTQPDGTGNDTSPDTTGCTLTPADCTASGQTLNEQTCMCEGGGDVTPDTTTGDTCTSAGQSCDPANAQPAQFRCVDDGSGAGTCEAACGANGECPVGSICIDTGTGGADDYCARSECAGFFENDCEGGDKCVPVGNGANFCFPNGTAVEDGACTAHTDCAADLLCVGGFCFAPTCDPLDGTPACAAGQTCSGLSAGDEPLPIGSCVTQCAPFTGTDTCAADGEWCFPGDRANDGSLRGTCTDDPGGTAAKGATCDNMSPATTCGTPDDDFEPLICLGECEQMCDPMDQATCDQAGGEGCFQVNLVDGDGNPIEVDWGLCNTNCTPSFDPADPGMGCETGEFCWPDFSTPGLAQCFQSSTGTKKDGEACDPNAQVEECENTTLCLITESDDNGNPIAGECTFLCDPAAAQGEVGSCGPSASGGQQTCLPLNGSNGPLAVGSCYETCQIDDLANFGCGPDADGNPQYCQVGTIFGIEGGVDLCTGIAFDTPLTEGASCGTDPAIEFNFCKENGLCIDLGTGSIECLELCSEERGQLGSAHPDCGGDVCQGAFGNVGFGVCQ